MYREQMEQGLQNDKTIPSALSRYSADTAGKNQLPAAMTASLIPGLRPLSIGNVYIGFPAIQAPLSGYSDRPQRYITKNLRDIVRNFPEYNYLPAEGKDAILGAAATVAEVMLDQFIISVKKLTKVNYYLGLDTSDHPCGAQIMGAQPEDFPKAALRLVGEDLPGGRRNNFPLDNSGQEKQSYFDWIDLNFACPVKKVLGRQRGGFLLSDPDTALEIIDRTRQALPDNIPLTVKMRKGFDDSSESEANFFRILDGALDSGVAAVAIHGRTVLQRYTGTADWDFIARVKRHVGNKIILGCGDLFTAQTCIDRILETNIDGVCIARGAIGNPWIFPDFNALALGLNAPSAPSLLQQAAVLAEHFNRCENLYGEQRTCSIIRKFGIKHAQLHPQTDILRKRFVNVRKRAEWFDILQQYYGFSEHPAANSPTE